MNRKQILKYKTRNCNCKVESALYSYMGLIRCQYCTNVVSGERADEYKKYNTPIGHEYK